MATSTTRVHTVSMVSSTLYKVDRKRFMKRWKIILNLKMYLAPTICFGQALWICYHYCEWVSWYYTFLLRTYFDRTSAPTVCYSNSVPEKFSFKSIFKNVNRRQQKHKQYPACKELYYVGTHHIGNQTGLWPIGNLNCGSIRDSSLRYM